MKKTATGLVFFLVGLKAREKKRKKQYRGEESFIKKMRRQARDKSFFGVSTHNSPKRLRW